MFLMQNKYTVYLAFKQLHFTITYRSSLFYTWRLPIIAQLKQIISIKALNTDPCIYYLRCPCTSKYN